MLAVLASFVNAADKDFYIGFGFGSGSGEYTYSDTTGTTNPYDRDYSLNDIKVGAIYKTNNRIELSYISIDVTGDSLADKSISGYDLDFIFTADLNRNDGLFLPFLTLGIGFYDWDDLIISGEQMNGVAINYGIGAYIAASEDIDIEISYKGKTITWQEIVFGSVTATLDETMTLFYIGARYNF